jgi:glucokinase
MNQAPPPALGHGSDSRLALALDLGGTKVEAALVDASGRLVPGTRVRQPTGPEASPAELAASVERVLHDVLPVDAPEIAGVGIGSAGPVDAARGLISPLNLPVWRDYPLVAQVEAVVESLVGPRPVTLRMDGLCIALAEHWVGAGRGVDDLMGMIVSTGIGGGLILGGRAIAGPSGNAGHVGHLEVAGFVDPCACGGTGCIEAVASGPKTVAWARSQGWTGSTGEELGAAYAAGDEIARAAVRRSGRAIGQAIAAATALVDLSVVAIGGGFSRVTPDLFDLIREPIAEHDFPFVRKVRVVPSDLSDEGPLIGAAALVHRAEMVPAV